MPATRHPASVTRMRVHDAALELFLDRGYEGTSLATIARRLGITKAAVYYYYRTKGDLLEALLAPMRTELTSLVEKVRAAAGRAQPEELLEAYADVLVRHRRLVLLVDRDPGIRCQPVVQSGVLAVRHQVELAILGERPDDDLRLRLLLLRAGISEALLAFPTWDYDHLRSALLRVGQLLFGPRPHRTRPAPSIDGSREQDTVRSRGRQPTSAGSPGVGTTRAGSHPVADPVQR